AGGEQHGGAAEGGHQVEDDGGIGVGGRRLRHGGGAPGTGGGRGAKNPRPPPGAPARGPPRRPGGTRPLFARPFFLLSPSSFLLLLLLVLVFLLFLVLLGAAGHVGLDGLIDLLVVVVLDERHHLQLVRNRRRVRLGEGLRPLVLQRLRVVFSQVIIQALAHLG